MYRLRWYCWAIKSGDRFSELRPIYQGCHVFTFAFASSCVKLDLKGITLSIIKTQAKKCDLSLRLKECKLSAWRTAAGKLFHMTGPATEKVLSPNFVLVLSCYASVYQDSHCDMQPCCIQTRWQCVVLSLGVHRTLPIAKIRSLRMDCKVWKPSLIQVKICHFID